MNTIPRIEHPESKKLVGLNLSMSYAENLTPQLWRGFMPRRDEITNAKSSDLFAVQIYPPGFFDSVDPSKPFVKWATKEVRDFAAVPEGMHTLEIPAGLYAVFHYKGDMTNAAAFFRYVFGEWLPGSEYILDDRPHFELLGAKYHRDSPDSEEDIWIPVKLKN